MRNLPVKDGQIQPISRRRNVGKTPRLRFTGDQPSFVEDVGGAFGTLTLSDGVHTASVILFGQFSASGFSASSDGSAGQVITYSPAIDTPAIAPPQ